MHDGATIKERQELPENIRLLAAMRQLYRQAKTSLALLFFLNIAVVVTLAIIALIVKSQVFNEWVALYGVVLTFIDIWWLTPRVERFCKKGAIVQEMFDCQVLGLPHNRIKQPVDLDSFDIDRAEESYNKKPGSSLNDWYDQVKAGMSPPEALLSAQLENINWERTQKKVWKERTIRILLIALFVVLISAIVQNLGTRRLLAYVMPLILPAVVFSLQYHRKLQEDIERLERLDDFTSRIEVEHYNQNQARQLQDAIYERRSQNTPVFEWMYERLRDKIKKAYYR